MWGKYKIVSVLGLLIWVLGFNCIGQVTIKNNQTAYELTHSPYSESEDSEGDLTIYDILKNQSLLKPMQAHKPFNYNSESAYWVKFSVIDSSTSDNNWIMELSNHRIDDIQLYIVSKNQIIHKEATGDLFPFVHKSIKYKGFSFHLPKYKNQKLDFYFRIKSVGKTEFSTSIKKDTHFVEGNNNQYFFHGLFYGLLCLVLVLNVLAILFIRDKTFLFYFCYAFCFMVYSAAQDGLGFQYLWPMHPWLNNHIFAFGLCFFIVSQLIFTYHFHKNCNVDPTHKKVLYFAGLARIGYLIFGLVFYPGILPLITPDIIYSLIMLWFGIVYFKKGNRPSLYFIIGVLCFMTGFGITTLSENGFLPNTWFNQFALKFGVVCEMLAFFISVGDASRRILLQRAKTEYDLKNKDKKLVLMDASQKELTSVIVDATDQIIKQNHIINMKNKDLEIFIYKSSHNLMGPVKTIKGLLNLSEGVDDISKLQDLFRLTKISNELLENEIIGINWIARVLQQGVNIVRTDLNDFSKMYFGTYRYIDANKQVDLLTDMALLIELQGITNAILAKVAQEDTCTYKLDAHKGDYSLEFVFAPVKLLRKEYVREFFWPYHRDISHFFNLDFEPYILKCTAEKLNGEVGISWVHENLLQLKITLRNMDVLK